MKNKPKKIMKHSEIKWIFKNNLCGGMGISFSNLLFASKENCEETARKCFAQGKAVKVRIEEI